MADVFISYHTDSGLDTVRDIAAALESAGVSCWYANRDADGSFYTRSIVQAIRNCKLFLLVLNEHSNVSEHVLNEVGLVFARVQKKQKVIILPFRVDECELSDDLLYYFPRIPIFDGRSENGPRIADLVERVGKLLGREPLQTKPAPEQPPAQAQLPGGLRPITLEEFVSATAPKRETKPDAAPAPSIVLPAQPRIITPKRKIYRPTIAAGYDFTVGIQTDGTVVGTGNSAWYDGAKSRRGIVSLAAGMFHTIELSADGTVHATGNNNDGQCNVSGWSGVVAVAAGVSHTIGLKADGTVLATGKKDDGQCNVSGWSGIVAVAAGYAHTIGLKEDGTVLATGRNNDGQYNVSDWSGVVSVAAGYNHTIGLKEDGTVFAAGWNEHGQCNVLAWSGVAAVAAGDLHTLGLKADGTILTIGSNNYEQCNVSGWSDVVAVAAGYWHTIVLKSDGTVLAVGRNNSGQCNVQNWRDIRLPEWVEI